MPRNRASIDRDEKVDEIVESARRRLVDGGYAAMSIADVARELGVAQNAIYWYFPSKDDLLVAIVERILHEVLERKPRAGTPIDRVLWFAERLAEFQDLRLTIRERARVSESVARFERDVIELLHILLKGSLSSSVAAVELDDITDAVMALCEGVLLRDLPKRRRTRLLRLGLDRLLTDGR